MTQSNGNQKPHPAQVFLWWASGFGIICGGLWTLFTFLITPKIEVDTFVQEVEIFIEKFEQARNDWAELQSRLRGQIAEEQEEAHKAIVQSLEQEKDTLYKEIATLEVTLSKAKLTEVEQRAADERLQVARASLDSPWLEPFSIWNSDDPIRILKDFGWRVSSDDFYGHYLGYYLNISHENVLDGIAIIVSRIFELERLRKNRPHDWLKQIQQISQRCGCPIMFLDESYYNLYASKLSEVGGLIYTADMAHSMHVPLSEWDNQLPRVLGGTDLSPSD